MGYRKYLQLEEIQNIELEMLKKIVDFCDEKKLRYFICGGTLLGAVRHEGFIPWDDDIDILMPRPDYEKLQQYLKITPIAHNLEAHSFELGNLNDPFCKICDTSTYIEKEYSSDEYDKHLWIDIFPMDGLPNDKKKIKLIYKKVLFLRTLIRFIKIKPEEINIISKTKWKAYLKYALKPVLKLIGKQRIVKKIRAICVTYDFDESILVGGIAFGYGPQEAMNREAYINGSKMKFEGVEVSVPGCWDVYLKNLYGNYMQLPPEDKRVAHLMKVWKEGNNI